MASDSNRLFKVIKCGDVDQARNLLERGKYDVNSIWDKDGMTLLHHACEQGHLDIVRMLVSEFKADVNVEVYFKLAKAKKYASLGYKPPYKLISLALYEGKEEVAVALHDQRVQL